MSSSVSHGAGGGNATPRDGRPKRPRVATATTTMTPTSAAMKRQALEPTGDSNRKSGIFQSEAACGPCVVRYPTLPSSSFDLRALPRVHVLNQGITKKLHEALASLRLLHWGLRNICIASSLQVSRYRRSKPVLPEHWRLIANASIYNKVDIPPICCHEQQQY